MNEWKLPNFDKGDKRAKNIEHFKNYYKSGNERSKTKAYDQYLAWTLISKEHIIFHMLIILLSE